jgi:hypothetical protein
MEVGVAPEIFTASSHTSECVPAVGFQWNLTKCDSRRGIDQRNVWTPKPSIVR